MSFYYTIFVIFFIDRLDVVYYVSYAINF